MFHEGLKVLWAKVRGFQAAGSTFAHRISQSEKERKHRLWNEKRRLGWHCRHHLIAYGILRGVPYDQIERCAKHNKPSPKLVHDLVQLHGDWKQKRDLTLEAVERLLTSPQAAPEVGA